MTKWPDKLVIVRHGESERNLERARIEEQDSDQLTLSITKRDPDIELTERGKKQAEVTGIGLKKEFGSFDLGFVSPYVRTRQTLEHILKNVDCAEVRAEERIREKEFGILDMYTKKGIREKFPEEHERKQREGKYYYRPPGGESYADVNLRVHSFLGSLIRSASEKKVLIVTHSVIVKSFRKTIEKLEEKDILEIDRVNDPVNCGVTSYSFDPGTGKLKLDYYNKIFY